MAPALAVLLAMGLAASARAATLDFTGTLYLRRISRFDTFAVAGAGTAQVTDDGNLHLLSLALPSGAFGPATVINYGGTVWSRLDFAQNLNGSFSGISGGPPGGGPMGLSGMAKLCVIFAGCGTYIPLPLTPTPGGAGFGIGGTRTATASGPSVTMQNAPWTIGQPTMTLHTPNSTITTPVLPGGFAHGPASLTSSTAQVGGVLQLVTVSKVSTSFPSAFPDRPLSGVLTLHFVPEPGTLLLLGSGVAVLAIAGRRRSRR